jgi:hypothetical protein
VVSKVRLLSRFLLDAREELKMKKSWLIVLLAFSCLLVACPAEPEPSQSIFSEPTNTPRPTQTPQPTNTSPPPQTEHRSDIQKTNVLLVPDPKIDGVPLDSEYYFRLTNHSNAEICEFYLASEGRDWSSNLLASRPLTVNNTFDTGKFPSGDTRLKVTSCNGRTISRQDKLYGWQGKGVEWEILYFE